MGYTQEHVNTLATPRSFVMNHVCFTVQTDQNICLGDMRGIMHTEIICLVLQDTSLTADLGFGGLTSYIYILV